ncbi:MAG: fatty acid desaturase [Verrucomicrobiae bacterium]|nr:fatty acid desaturase [Verrucomicrobiae bacterium]
MPETPSPVPDQDQIKWHRVPVDKKVMSALMQRSDARGLWQLGRHLALVLATGSVAYYSWYQWPWYVTVILCHIHGSFYTFLGPGAAVHELSHKTVFKSPWLNDFALRLVSFLTIWNYHHYRSSHVKHHQLTVYKGLDLEVELPLKITPWLWFNVLFFNFDMLKVALLSNLRYAFGRIEGEWEHRILPESNRPLRQDLAHWSRFVLIGHLVLLAVFIYFKLWPMIVLVTLATYIGNWLNFLVGFPQHAGLQPSVPDFRLCCRTFVCHPFPSFLYWRMNYHVEHHMYPAVPCYNLPRLRAAMEPSLPRATVGLYETWKEILGILKRQKAEPGYYHVPRIPDASRDEITDSDEMLREAMMQKG